MVKKILCVQVNACRVQNWHKASLFVCGYLSLPIKEHLFCTLVVIFCQLTKPGVRLAKRVDQKIVTGEQELFVRQVKFAVSFL